MGGIKEEPPTDGEEYSSEHEISENSEGTSKRLFILSNRAFLTPAQYMKCLEKVEEIKFKPPFYVSIMSKTTVWQHDNECSPILSTSTVRSVGNRSYTLPNGLTTDLTKGEGVLLTGIGDEDAVGVAMANSKGSTKSAANTAVFSAVAAASSADLKSQPPPVVRQ
ncbi:B3 domain-containing protein [Hordeum vulgare]|nr:B3 domain-containing protein [Hordeum vulgare]